MWRQGDILIQAVESIPEEAKRVKSQVIASSKTTGHEHKLKEKKVCRVFESATENFVEVYGDKVSLVHPEHGTIELPTGTYRLWRQREFTGTTVRPVWD